MRITDPTIKEVRITNPHVQSRQKSLSTKKVKIPFDKNLQVSKNGCMFASMNFYLYIY